MDADGTKNGYDLPMLEAVSRAVNIPVVASGGAGQPGAPAAGVRGRRRRGPRRQHLPLQRVQRSRTTKAYLAARGVPVRIVRAAIP